MSFKVATIRVAAATGGGTQTITTSKLGGLTPKAAILIATWATADGTDTDHGSLSIGLTDGTNHAVVSTMDEHNQANASNARWATNDEVVLILDPINDDVECEANFSTWVADGMDIVWGVTPPSAFLLTVMFFAGSDLTAYVDDGGGSALGCGFTPDVCIGVSHRAGWADSLSTNQAMSFGVCVNDGAETQYSINTSGADGTTVGENALLVSDDAIIENIFKTSTFTPSVITGFTSNGFTLTGSLFSYLLMEFNGAFSAEIIPYTTASSTGDDAITGAGFKPQAAIVGVGDDAAAYDTRYNASIFSILISAIDDTDQYANENVSKDAGENSNTHSRSDDTAIYYSDHNGSQASIASFSSFDSDGLTLNYSDVSEPSMKGFILVFEEDTGDAPEAPPGSLEMKRPMQQFPVLEARV